MSVRDASVRGVRQLALVVALAFLPACPASTLPQFPVERAGEIARGVSKRRVEELVGRPQHVWLLDEHPEHCAERWTWANVTRGFVTMNVEALVVDFDEAGRVCDVGHSK